MDTSMLTQVITAAAQGAAGQAGQQAWAALTALARRYPRDPAPALDAARAGNPALLARLLTRQADGDPGFAAELGEWAASTYALLHTGHQVGNQVTGPVSGTVIQAGDISGGITIGGTGA